MPVTFGSVGDIISVSILVKSLVRCLNESRGSSAEYQAVIRELGSLDDALLGVALLLPSCEQSEELGDLCNSVNRCAEQCRKCVEDFKDKTKKYQSALQRGGTVDLIRDTAAKIRWHVSMKEDLAKFRAEITSHSSSLNMLLATASIKFTILNDKGMQKRLEQSDSAHASSSATQTSLVADLKSRLDETNSLIQLTASETKALSSRIDLDYFRKLGVQFLSFMHNILKINFMTYNAVVALQARIPAQLNRTWTQDPAIFEDALGRVTPFHLEFMDSWEAFEAVLEVRFRQLPGHRKVKQKEYALGATFINKDVDKSIAFSRCFLPGRHYDMSMIFNATRTQNSCPACLLGTGEAFDARVNCKGCGLFYQRIVETVVDEPSVVEKTPVPLERPRPKGQQEADSQSDDEPRQFRRVRLRCLQQAENQGFPDEAESGTLSESGWGTIKCICGHIDHAQSVREARTWLIQCVDCKVWQHRSCVGTANGYDPPGGYYCEECREMKPIDSLVNEDAEECTNECIDDGVKENGVGVNDEGIGIKDDDVGIKDDGDSTKDESNTLHRDGHNNIAFMGSPALRSSYHSCCACGNLVNRTLNDLICAICGHRRCASCGRMY